MSFRAFRRTQVVLAALLAGGVSLAATDSYGMKAQGLTAPVFDASNHLIRRLVAESAVVSLTATQLEKGRVEFFSPTLAGSSIAVLEFASAHYIKSDERIDGDGSISLASNEGTVRGQGFECQLETGELTLKFAVTFTSAETKISSAHGDIRFDPKATREDSLIKEATLTDHVVLERSPTAKAPFQRAETTLARYSAEQKKLFLKTPVTLWTASAGRPPEKTVVGSGTEFFEIDLTEKPSGKTAK